MSGIDVQNFPRYYVPYGERTQAGAGEAVKLSRGCARTEPVTREGGGRLARLLGHEGRTTCAALLLRTRFAWVAVLVDPKTAQPVKMLLGEKIT